uniref:Origin recognition complex subunit 1 n=1 Tax=Petromyzon marinus TaxID=7757 RepID=A0AAJ7UJ23_PETMA|nr:origin recognition complex subunit 1-like [Petromyzon marinus]
MPRYNTRNSGSTIVDSGSKIRSSGSTIPDSGPKTRSSGSKIPDSGSSILDSGGSRKRRAAEDHGRRLGHVTPVMTSPDTKCTLVPRVSISDILSLILSDETDDGDDDGTHQQYSVNLTPTSRKRLGNQQHQQQQSDILRLAPVSSPLRVKTTTFQPSRPPPSSLPPLPSSPPSPPPPSSSTSPPPSSPPPSSPPSSLSPSSSSPSSPPSSSSLSSPSSPSSSASSSPVPVRRTKKVLRKPQTKAQKTKTTRTPKLPSRTQALKTETGPSVSLPCLPCRESEFHEILDFVESKLDTLSGGCMFISGVPGTGKTATIRAVLSYLVDQAGPRGDEALTVVSINAMELTEPRQVYSKLLKAMSGERAAPSRAAQILNELFARRSKRSVLLILDELDLLVTRRQDLLYSLSDWATGGSSCLILLAIANTLDLPERVMLTRVSSRLGLTRMCFQPYSFQQLQEIARSHLSGVASFEPDALQLVARKVAALSGDARRMLDVCRRAAEIAAAEVKASSSISPTCPTSSSANGRRAAGRSRDPARAAAVAANGKEPRVGLRQVGAALEETFRSPCVAATRECSSLDKFFLEAVLSEFSRTGLEETSFGQVFVSLRSLLLLSGHPPCSVSAALGSCSRLLSARLLLSSSTPGLRRRLRLNVPRADLLYALRGGDSA